MKKIYYCLLMLLLVSNSICSQYIEKGKDFVVDGITYEFIDDGVITRKNNKIERGVRSGEIRTKIYKIDERILESLSRTLFTKKRSEDFTYDDKVGFLFFGDSSGRVKEVSVFFMFEDDEIKLSPQEIKKIEDAVLRLEVNNLKYYSFEDTDYYDVFWVFCVRCLHDDNFRENRRLYRENREKNKK